jgi:AraC-like DNA-binding protein
MKEICFLLRAYYTVEELFWIFRPILTNDLTFSDKVMKMWPKYATIRELAHELGYTPSGFYKRFLLVFGVQPQKWVTEQKINAITTDLLASTMSLKDLAHKWNFSDTHAFHNWCRKNLKQSPNSIRGDLRVTSIPEKVSV